MTLRSRYVLLTVTFLIGGIAIGYFAVTRDSRIALLEPAWLLMFFIATLFAVRCSRCGWPATLALIHLARLRIWLWMPGVVSECPRCGLRLQ